MRALGVQKVIITLEKLSLAFTLVSDKWLIRYVTSTFRAKKLTKLGCPNTKFTCPKEKKAAKTD